MKNENIDCEVSEEEINWEVTRDVTGWGGVAIHNNKMLKDKLSENNPDLRQVLISYTDALDQKEIRIKLSDKERTRRSMKRDVKTPCVISNLENPNTNSRFFWCSICDGKGLRPNGHDESMYIKSRHFYETRE